MASAMYTRSHKSGIVNELSHKMASDVLKNVRIVKSMPKMLELDFGLDDELYIRLSNVKIKHVNGNGELVKLVIEDISTETWETIQEYAKAIQSLDSNMTSLPKSKDSQGSLKLVLKHKWFRAFAPDGSKIESDIDTVTRLYNSRGSLVTIEIHVGAMRTHLKNISFQPLIRKITFHS